MGDKCEIEVADQHHNEWANANLSTNIPRNIPMGENLKIAWTPTSRKSTEPLVVRLTDTWELQIAWQEYRWVKEKELLGQLYLVDKSETAASASASAPAAARSAELSHGGSGELRRPSYYHSAASHSMVKPMPKPHLLTVTEQLCVSTLSEEASAALMAATAAARQQQQQQQQQQATTTTSVVVGGGGGGDSTANVTGGDSSNSNTPAAESAACRVFVRHAQRSICATGLIYALQNADACKLCLICDVEDEEGMASASASSLAGGDSALFEISFEYRDEYNTLAHVGAGGGDPTASSPTLSGGGGGGTSAKGAKATKRTVRLVIDGTTHSALQYTTETGEYPQFDPSAFHAVDVIPPEDDETLKRRIVSCADPSQQQKAVSRPSALNLSSSTKNAEGTLSSAPGAGNHQSQSQSQSQNQAMSSLLSKSTIPFFSTLSAAHQNILALTSATGGTTTFSSSSYSSTSSIQHLNTLQRFSWPGRMPPFDPSGKTRVDKSNKYIKAPFRYVPPPPPTLEDKDSIF